MKIKKRLDLKIWKNSQNYYIRWKFFKLLAKVEE